MKKAGILFLIFVTAISSFGCSLWGDLPAPDKSPEEVISQGFKNLANMQSSEFELSLDTDLVSSNGEKSYMEGEINGAFNSKNAENPIFGIEFDIGTNTGSVSGEFRAVDEAVYAKVSDLDFSGAEIFADAYIGTWWEIPAEMGVNDSIPLQAGFSDSQKESINTFAEAEILQNIEYVGSDKIGGVESFHYKGNFSKELLKEFMVSALSFAGAYLDGAEEEIEKNMENLVATGDIWVGAIDMTVRKMSAEISNEMDGAKLDYTIYFELAALNEDVTVEVPDDAEEFDPNMLLPLMMLGAGLEEGTEEDTSTESLDLGEDLEASPEILDNFPANGEVPVE